MPQTRADISRDEKMEEILGAAERRLAEGGYEALSVAGIARELGIAQNAVYWYFPSKDDLFVAALRRLLAGIVARKPSHQDADDVERILWFTDQFEELSTLRAAMTERARSSQVVADFVAELDGLLDQMLSNTLQGHIPDAELPIAVDAFRATVDGTTAKGLRGKGRRNVLEYALRRIAFRGEK